MHTYSEPLCDHRWGNYTFYASPLDHLRKVNDIFPPGKGLVVNTCDLQTSWSRSPVFSLTGTTSAAMVMSKLIQPPFTDL